MESNARLGLFNKHIMIRFKPNFDTCYALPVPISLGSSGKIAILMEVSSFLMSP